MIQNLATIAHAGKCRGQKPVGKTVSNNRLKRLPLPIWLTTLLSLASCSDAAPTVEKIPVPEGAYAITKRLLNSESAGQFDFKARVSFQSFEIADFKKNLYTHGGWHQCPDGDDWTVYVKKVGGGIYLPTRQHLRYLASRQQKKILLVALFYYGSQEKIPTRRLQGKLMVRR